MESKTSKMGGKEITLIGPELKVGDKAPDFSAVDTSMTPKSLSDYKSKIKLIATAPSLDTEVCDTQTRRFNDLALKLGDNIVVLTISMDLPTAQKRWCGASGVDHVITLSDHREAAFGKNYGVLIKELRLLNRAVFIIDENDIIRYIEIVEENHNQPNYDKALEALKSL